MYRTVYVCIEDFFISWCSTIGVPTAGSMFMNQDDVQLFAYMVNVWFCPSALASSRVFVITAMAEVPAADGQNLDWHFYE